MQAYRKGERYRRRRGKRYKQEWEEGDIMNGRHERKEDDRDTDKLRRMRERYTELGGRPRHAEEEERKITGTQRTRRKTETHRQS